MKCYMKVARMYHSMIYIDNKNLIFTVGGEDENGNLLDSCEVYTTNDNHWKMLNTLNYKGKNLGLCKFIKENKKSGDRQYIYAFGKKAIERIDISKTPIDPKWEELTVSNYF